MLLLSMFLNKLWLQTELDHNKPNWHIFCIFIKKLKVFFVYADKENVNLWENEVLMPAMTVGGLASGLDTNSIISQLTALEQMKVTRELQKKDNVQLTLDKFKELETMLLAFQTKAKGLDLAAAFNVFKSTSSKEDYASISGNENATAGSYDLTINQLATSQKVASKSFGAVNVSLKEDGLWTWGSDTITLNISTSAAAQKSDPSKKTVEVKINQNDTLKDIANKINSAEGAGVKASLMTLNNGENRLVLTAVDTGTQSFYINEDGGTNFLSDVLGLINDKEQKATSGNALVTTKGEVVTEDTKFNELNTYLNKNNFDKDSVLRITLPGSDHVLDYDLYENGNFLNIGDVLEKINEDLDDAGAKFTVSLNNGEIVVQGNLADDPNFKSSELSKVKIQFGNNVTKEGGETIFEVKKDMGTFTSQPVFSNVLTEAQNAFYTVDGIAVTSRSNNDDKTVAGTTFSLLKVTEPDEVIKLSLDMDKDAVSEKIIEFVEEFNELLKFIDENMRATVTEKTDDTGKRTSTRVVGPFTGDTNISSLRDNLKRMFTGMINELNGIRETVKNPDTDKMETVTRGYSTAYSSISRLGITTTREGFMEIDKDKLNKALETDFDGIRRLFTANSWSDTTGYSVGRFTKDTPSGIYTVEPGGRTDDSGKEWAAGVYLNGKLLEGVVTTGNIITTKDGLSIEIPLSGDGYGRVVFARGIASQITSFVEKARDYVDGYFKTSKEAYERRIAELEKRADDLQVRVDRYNARMMSQFTSLEKNMSNLQAQSANLVSALSSLTYNTGKK